MGRVNGISCNGAGANPRHYDDVEVQAALDNLPAEGGTLYLEGTLTFSKTVSRAINDVTIRGGGLCTRINLDGATPVFDCTGLDGWRFEDFDTDAGGITTTSATSLLIAYWLDGVLQQTYTAGTSLNPTTDGSYKFDFADSATPRMTWDANDRNYYDRTGNRWGWQIGGIDTMLIYADRIFFGLTVCQELRARTTPTTPSSGLGRFFGKTVGGRTLPHWIDEGGTEIDLGGAVFTEVRSFTETAEAGTYTATVVLPAGATVLDVRWSNQALWTAATSATLDVGDGDDPDGYFDAVDLQAAPIADVNGAGGISSFLKDTGAGLYSGLTKYSASAQTITATVVTVGATGSAGRSRLRVLWSIAPVTAATKA